MSENLKCSQVVSGDSWASAIARTTMVYKMHMYLVEQWSMMTTLSDICYMIQYLCTFNIIFIRCSCILSGLLQSSSRTTQITHILTTVLFITHTYQ